MSEKGNDNRRRPPRHPIEAMIDAVMSCVICGTKGMGNCDCWVECECGRSYEKDGLCPNEVHRCTYIDPQEGRCVWEVVKGKLFCKEHRRSPI